MAAGPGEGLAAVLPSLSLLSARGREGAPPSLLSLPIAPRFPLQQMFSHQLYARQPPTAGRAVLPTGSRSQRSAGPRPCAENEMKFGVSVT